MHQNICNWPIKTLKTYNMYLIAPMTFEIISIRHFPFYFHLLSTEFVFITESSKLFQRLYPRYSQKRYHLFDRCAQRQAMCLLSLSILWLSVGTIFQKKDPHSKMSLKLYEHLVQSKTLIFLFFFYIDNISIYVYLFV